MSQWSYGYLTGMCGGAGGVALVSGWLVSGVALMAVGLALIVLSEIKPRKDAR